MKLPGMMQKWSSKPKEQRAARIRDNQRRHRTRVKTYIGELERHLAEERARVEKITAHNAALIAELEKLRANATDQSVPNSPPEGVGGRPLLALVSTFLCLLPLMCSFGGNADCEVRAPLGLAAEREDMRSRRRDW